MSVKAGAVSAERHPERTLLRSVATFCMEAAALAARQAVSQNQGSAALIEAPSRKRDSILSIHASLAQSVQAHTRIHKHTLLSRCLARHPMRDAEKSTKRWSSNETKPRRNN